MPKQTAVSSPSRRDLLRMIGVTAGSAAMYQAMSSMGFAADSPYRGPIDLQGAPAGASVLILGAGIAGMCAAFELRNAGYQVQVLEFNGRAGGRNWSLRGGDSYTELGGLTQKPADLRPPSPVERQPPTCEVVSGQLFVARHAEFVDTRHWPCDPDGP